MSGKLFIRAARYGEVQDVRDYLRKASFAQKGKALFHAVNEGHFFVTKVLLEEGGILPTGPSLLEAVKKKYHNIVELLLNCNVRKDYAASNGKTALMEAVIAGDERMVSILLNASVSLELLDGKNKSALFMALQGGRMGIAKKLLEFGASGRLLGHFLPSIIRIGNVELVQLFLYSGVNPNVEYQQGYPLHNAIETGSEEMVTSLLDAGANVHAVNQKGRTALFCAVSGGFVRITKVLVNHDSTIVRDEMIEKAVKSGNSELVLCLIEAVTKSKTSGISLRGALLTATMMEYENVVDGLIKAGADVNSVCENGRSALYYALSKNNILLAKLLVRHGAEATSCDSLMKDAIVDGNIEHVRLLLKCGADPNVIIDMSNRRHSIILAVQYSQKDVLYELLAAGADVNVVCEKGRSALYYAITGMGKEEVKLEIAELLVRHGAEAISCESLMKNAIVDGNVGQVRLLLNSGADPNAIDESKRRLSLITAVQYGRGEILRELVTAGADVNSVCERGRSSLYYSITSRRLEMAELLIQHGAEAISCEVLIWKAVKEGNMEEVRLLLSCGVDLDCIHPTIGEPVLVTAAEYYRKEILCELVTAGANVNNQARGGRTALMWAACHGDVEMVKILLNAGADVNALQEKKGYTAIMYAAEEGHENVIQELIDANANLEIRNWRNETVLHCLKRSLDGFVAIWQQLKWLMDSNRYENVDVSYFPIAARFFNEESATRLKKLDRALIDKNVENVDGLTNLFGSGDVKVNERDHLNRTILMYMAYKGHTGIVALLLSTGANVNMKDSRGMTALTWATHGRNVDVVQILISFGASVNVMDNLNRSALHHAIRARDIFISIVLMNAKGELGSPYMLEGAIIWAAKAGHAFLVHELCKMRVDINELDDYGTTALIWAAYGGHKTCVNELVRWRANINSVDWHGRTALWYALDQGHDDVVNILLPDSGLKNIDNGCPALCVAARREKIQIMKDMLSRGVDIEWAEPNGTTALLCAAEVGSFDMVDMLLKKGADVKSSNASGETALHFAAYANAHKIIDLLVENKANIEGKNKHGLTPLLMGSREGNSEAVETLLNRGADVTAVDAEGTTALDLAIREGEEITDGRAKTAENLIAWGSEGRDVDKTANAVLAHFQNKKKQKMKGE